VILLVVELMFMWLPEFLMTMPGIPESEMRRLDPWPMMKGRGALA